MFSVRSLGAAAMSFALLFSVIVPVVPASAEESEEIISDSSATTLSVTGRARIEIPPTDDSQKKFSFNASIQIFDVPTAKEGVFTDREIVKEIKNTLGKNLISLDTSWYNIYRNEVMLPTPMYDVVEPVSKEGSEEKDTVIGVENAIVEDAPAEEKKYAFTIQHDMMGVVFAENMEDAAEMTSALMDIGMDNTVVTVNSVTPYYEDTSTFLPNEKTEATALKIAFKNAKQKGERIADALGMKLGNPTSVSDSGYVSSVWINNITKTYYFLDINITYELWK